MKILKNILICCVMVGFFACEDATEFTVTGSDYVAFLESSANLAEAGVTTTQDGTAIPTNSTYVATVIRSSGDLSSDLTVNFTVAGTFATTSDFADAGDDASSTFTSSADGSIVIPAGKTSASFTVTSINDAFSSGNKNLVLTITGATGHTVGFASGAVSGTLAITIVDDDCPIDLTTFEGNYTMASFGTANSCCDGFDLCASAARDCSGFVTLTADASDPSGTSAILNHASFGSPYGIKFITCPGNVEVITPMSTWFGNGWQMQQGPTLGTYNDDSKAITIIGQLGGNGEFTMELTKQ